MKQTHTKFDIDDDDDDDKKANRLINYFLSFCLSEALYTRPYALRMIHFTLFVVPSAVPLHSVAY